MTSSGGPSGRDTILIGLAGGTANWGMDFIPYKFSGKLGLAAALSNAEPNQGGRAIGLEANLRLGYQIGAFMEAELHAAHLWLGDFYDSPLVNGGTAGRPVNPYTALLVFKWLMF